ncbi:sulfite exporter TauE/SafE family protein [Breoghania sp. L-A4]|uniref:sulfite exporter TauE/SafE family protein n=1 Tax=Breoghania sp. L-A4 TaxID=2304600 RepID=UPI000E35E36D|nr:sulfite exporter TauE/SafE family protein [Breoghania sp. L-A4]AXS39349.1 sulfite exporter TauE/SafE family protein [Breoghania sp. L-A4]
MIFEVMLVVLCLALGGMLKGATGAGAPVLAVPALAAFFDVQTAVVLLLLPNLFANGWQLWLYRRELPENRFLLPFVAAGIAGVSLGTWMLTALRSETLSVGVSIVVILYIAFRLARPHWKLSMPAGIRLATPAGFLSGILQGASGISAPVSLTFLNALQLGRPTFIATVSLLFMLFVAVQIPALAWAGLITVKLGLMSLAAVVPIFLAMPLGGMLARRLSPAVFDRLILGFLGLLAVKLLFDALG